MELPVVNEFCLAPTTVNLAEGLAVPTPTFPLEEEPTAPPGT